MTDAWVVDLYQPAAPRLAFGRWPIVQILFYGHDREAAVKNYLRQFSDPEMACGSLKSAILDGIIDGQSAYASAQYRQGVDRCAPPTPIAAVEGPELVALVIDSHDPQPPDEPPGVPVLTHVFYAARDEAAAVSALRALQQHQSDCHHLAHVVPSSIDRLTSVRWYDGGWIER